MDETKSCDVFALITSFNPTDKLINLVSILSRDSCVKKVLIYDNHSNDVSLLKMLEVDYAGFVTVEYSSTNNGIGIAYNSLINKYHGDETFLVTFDQDSIPEEHMVEVLRDRLIYLHSRNKKFISIGPKIAPLSMQYDSTKRKRLRDIIITRPILITAGNLYYSSAFFSLLNRWGGYDEKMFIDCVDYDFSLKLRNYGYLLCTDHSVKLYQDDENNGDGIRIYGENRLYHMIRNKIILNRKYFFKFPLYIILSTVRSFGPTYQQLTQLESKEKARLLIRKAYNDAKQL